MLTQRYEIGHKGAGDRATYELKRFRDEQDLTRTTVIALAITITENILHFDFRHTRRFSTYKIWISVCAFLILALAKKKLDIDVSFA